MSTGKRPHSERPPWPVSPGSGAPSPAQTAAGSPEGVPREGVPREEVGASSQALATPEPPLPPVAPVLPVSGLTSDLPTEEVVGVHAPFVPDGAILADGQVGGAEAVLSGGGAVAGLVLTLAIHVGLVLVVFLANRGEGRTEPRPPQKEMIIDTQILEVQAGSPEGMREEGPAFKRRNPRSQPRDRAEDPPSEVVLGTSGRPAHPVPQPMTPRPQVTPGKDDAISVPGDWGSETGVPAPPGAKPSDDRYGAGGTAEKGALDPCFTQHAQVVAGYRVEVASKIPPMPRPAFITSGVAENLFTSVRVGIDSNGKIVSTQVAKSSGEPRFDGAAVEHVRGVATFPAPHRCVMYDKAKGLFRDTVTFSVTIKSR